MEIELKPKNLNRGDGLTLSTGLTPLLRLLDYLKGEKGSVKRINRHIPSHVTFASFLTQLLFLPETLSYSSLPTRRLQNPKLEPLSLSTFYCPDWLAAFGYPN
jgi:hypothetical protein